MKVENEKDTVTFLVSFPVALEQLIKERAKKERRSRNAQIVISLEEIYKAETSEKVPQPA